MAEEHVILVDEADNEIGQAEKLYAHEQGLLHRAISVFIFNSKGEWLLQKRADGKYHSGGLWTNACCSHPRPGEDTASAAHRRLKEEMGIDCELNFLFSFQYKADVGNELIEHELDHVFVGITDEIPRPDSHEIGAWKYYSSTDLTGQLRNQPETYTAWFRLIFDRVKMAV